jgi:hypothetical protein
MSRSCPIVRGDLRQWPTKERMAEILRDAGLRVTVGKYSVRIDDCSHFVFQQYGGDLDDPRIDADADSVTEMLRDTERVSSALSRAGFIHSFEVYDEHETVVGYFHYGWPQTNAV